MAWWALVATGRYLSLQFSVLIVHISKLSVFQKYPFALQVHLFLAHREIKTAMTPWLSWLTFTVVIWAGFCQSWCCCSGYCGWNCSRALCKILFCKFESTGCWKALWNLYIIPCRLFIMEKVQGSAKTTKSQQSAHSHFNFSICFIIDKVYTVHHLWIVADVW